MSKWKIILIGIVLIFGVFSIANNEIYPMTGGKCAFGLMYFDASEEKIVSTLKFGGKFYGRLYVKDGCVNPIKYLYLKMVESNESNLDIFLRE